MTSNLNLEQCLPQLTHEMKRAAKNNSQGGDIGLDFKPGQWTYAQQYTHGYDLLGVSSKLMSHGEFDRALNLFAYF